MTNPVARESTVNFLTAGDTTGEPKSYPAYRHVMVFCPACEQAHPFTIEVFTKPDGTPYSPHADGRPMPVWGWDGNLERPTFTPSMLAYYTVHLCPPDYVHSEVCEGYGTDACQHKGHSIEWQMPDGTLIPNRVDKEQPEGSTEVYTTYLPHAVEPAFGNCHSFLQQGRWNFLSDCAHAMAGQSVDMVPLPDYLMGGDRPEA